MKKLMIIAVMFLPACWTDDSEALRALESNGFTNAHITNRSGVMIGYEGCGRDDGAVYEAMATNAIGKQVTVVVCCGGAMSFKGCVVRTK